MADDLHVEAWLSPTDNDITFLRRRAEECPQVFSEPLILLSEASARIAALEAALDWTMRVYNIPGDRDALERAAIDQAMAAKGGEAP